MARDNSPKERQKRQLERKQGKRASYDRVLIVSEGTETEPNYFKEIRSFYRLYTANVQVVPSGYGTAPDQVVDYAETLFINGNIEKRIQKRAFEKVYVVIDRDDHKSYYNAISKVTSLNRKKLKNDSKQPVKFIAIPSVPCFEIWFLLHFEDILAFTDRNDITEHLERHVPDYSKGRNDMFRITSGKLDTAIDRAETLRERGYSAYSHDPPQPFTDVDILVKELIAMGKKN